jgi:hypothetical protein
MKIENVGKTKSFSSINKGEVFVCQGHYYIKTETYCDSINAVNLSTGNLQYFNSSFEVELCPKAILKIN